MDEQEIPAQAGQPLPPADDDAGWSDLATLLRGVADAEHDAAQAFAATLELVSGEVAVLWGDPLPIEPGPGGGDPVSHMPVFDARYPAARSGSAPHPAWGAARFEWSFGISELRADRPGEVAFAAGVAVPIHADGGLLDEDPEWLGERRAGGFERLHNPRLAAEQLLRWLDIDVVLAAGEPGEQADLVADWIVSTFAELAAAPPGRGAR